MKTDIFSLSTSLEKEGMLIFALTNRKKIRFELWKGKDLLFNS
jgi:hypothetical protein